MQHGSKVNRACKKGMPNMGSASRPVGFGMGGSLSLSKLGVCRGARKVDDATFPEGAARFRVESPYLSHGYSRGHADAEDGHDRKRHRLLRTSGSGANSRASAARRGRQSVQQGAHCSDDSRHAGSQVHLQRVEGADLEQHDRREAVSGRHAGHHLSRIPGQPGQEGDSLPVLRRGGQISSDSRRRGQSDQSGAQTTGNLQASQERDSYLFSNRAGFRDRSRLRAVRSARILCPVPAMRPISVDDAEISHSGSMGGRVTYPRRAGAVCEVSL